MVLHDAVEQIEPELGELGEHLALVGDLVFQNVVEGRDAVGGHEQQPVAQIVQIAHLALRVGGDVDSRHGTPFLLDGPAAAPLEHRPTDAVRAQVPKRFSRIGHYGTNTALEPSLHRERHDTPSVRNGQKVPINCQSAHHFWPLIVRPAKSPPSVSRFAWSEDAAIDENMDARAPNAASGPFLAKTGPAQGATRS